MPEIISRSDLNVRLQKQPTLINPSITSQSSIYMNI